MAADQILIFHSSPEFNRRHRKEKMPPKAMNANMMSVAAVVRSAGSLMNFISPAHPPNFFHLPSVFCLPFPDT
jgi:hypothetical protein